jgi:methionyl-tRNA formyltransferase
LGLGLRVFQPQRISTSEGIEIIRSARPDAGVVCAYGEIVSGDVLAAAPRGFLNIHASLLPRFRGAAPIQHAILRGDEATGVTIIKLVEKMDAGGMAGAVQTPIGPEETAGELAGRLSKMGAELLLDVLERVEDGTVVFERQDESKVTCAPKLGREDARINWSLDADYLARFVRAMSPAPGAFTFFDRAGQRTRLIVQKARAAESSGEPGSVLQASGGRLLVAAGRSGPGRDTGRAALEVEVLKPAGKRAMTAAEFLRGYELETGSVLG